MLRGFTGGEGKWTRPGEKDWHSWERVRRIGEMEHDRGEGTMKDPQTCTRLKKDLRGKVGKEVHHELNLARSSGKKKKHVYRGI